MEYYPFVKCLSPRKIHNPYNHQDMIVPCGKCEACSLRKSSMNTLRVQLESKQHLYCKFITLTYSNDYIPRMYLAPTENGDYEIYDDEYYNQIGTLSSFQLKDYETLCRKCEAENVPFLRKYDLQKFFKRLRKYFSDNEKKYHIPYGKIRYYACGEYGPRHFRPHYHVILWTSCDNILSEIGKAVSTCWQYGRVSTETPFQDVSRYVAQYVNSSVPLPSLLKLSETKPFSVHSLHLGESFFQETKEEIYESSFEAIVKRGVIISNNYTDVAMWRSLKTYYFPRCKEYDLLTSQQRLYSYTLIKRLFEKYPERKDVSLSSLTEWILRLWKEDIERFGYVREEFHRDLMKYAGADWCFYQTDKAYQSVFRSLYMILRISKHFLYFVCDGNWSYFNINKMFNKVQTFWQDNELFNLNNRYQSIEEHFDEIFESEEEYQFLFTNNVDKIINTKVFKKFYSERKNHYLRSMKHKEQNDLNRVFETI